LRGCRRISEKYELPMQTHVGEGRYQAGVGEIRYGNTLLGYMDSIGLVGPWFSVAHGVWLTDEDLAILAKRGAGLSHNAGSNMRLASGIAPARKAIDAGVVVGIGTDGSGSSDNQNMFEAMRLAAFASRLFDVGAEDWIGAAEAIRLGTQGSAKVMGLADSGTIEPGKAADLVFLDLAHTNWAPFNDVANQMVYGEDGMAVRDVMIDGVWRLRDGKVLGVDEAKLWREANATAARLREANAPMRAWCEQVAPHVACHCAGLAKRFTRVQRLLPVR
jgi:guanine deaminase